MNWIKRSLYRATMAVGRGYTSLRFDLRVWGREKIPPGAKIYASNHICANEPNFVFPNLPDIVHAVVGPGYNRKNLPYKLLATLLDRFEQINAMPADRKSVVETAVRYLKKQEAVYIAPEGDLQELFQLGTYYPGVAKIYRESGAPIIPIGLLAAKRYMRDYPSLDNVVDGRRYRALFVRRGPYCINIGAPFYPEVRDDVEEETDNKRIAEELRLRTAALVEEIRSHKFWLE